MKKDLTKQNFLLSLFLILLLLSFFGFGLFLISQAKRTKKETQRIQVVPRKVKPAEDIQGDVWVRFDNTHCNDFYPFSSTPGVLGKVYWVRFDSTDNLYQEVHGEECCLPGGCRQVWGSHYVNSTRKGPWVVERKELSPDRYKLLIRGASQADCICGGDAYVKGEAQVMPTSGWRIVEINKCKANSDNRGREIYCEVNKETGRIKFSGGSTCGGCCCCIDSGHIDIEVIVEREGESWL